MDYFWRDALSKAIRGNQQDAHHRYLQVATVRRDGSPANRTLVFRGFFDKGEVLQMVTDLRSEKVDQIQHERNAEICWYFTRSREQFRLSGSLAAVGDPAVLPATQALSTARESLWASLSPAARAQFFWPEPGKPLDDSGALEETDAAPETFMLLLFTATRVDHLQLSGKQRRMLSQHSGKQWHCEAVNP